LTARVKSNRNHEDDTNIIKEALGHDVVFGRLDPPKEQTMPHLLNVYRVFFTIYKKKQKN
jgi:hypothetical protein